MRESLTPLRQLAILLPALVLSACKDITGEAEALVGDWALIRADGEVPPAYRGFYGELSSSRVYVTEATLELDEDGRSRMSIYAAYEECDPINGRQLSTFNRVRDGKWDLDGMSLHLGGQEKAEFDVRNGRVSGDTITVTVDAGFLYGPNSVVEMQFARNRSPNLIGLIPDRCPPRTSNSW